MKKIIIIALTALLAVAAGSLNCSAACMQAKEKTTVFLTDMDCAHCQKRIEAAIPFEKGVKDVKVDLKTKLVDVTYDPAKTNDATLIKAFAKIKVKAQVYDPKKK